MTINNRAIELQREYWVEVPYTGRTIDPAAVVALGNNIKHLLVSSAIKLVIEDHPYISPSSDLVIAIATSPVRRDFLFTPLDTINLEYKATNDEALLKGVDCSAYLKQALSSMASKLDLDTKSLSSCCPPTSLHDVLAHTVIEACLDEGPESSLSELPDRLWYRENLNVHFMFGRLLSILFLEAYELGMNRLEILNYMIKKLRLYLLGETSLITKDGKLAKVLRPITTYEARMAANYHRNELEISYYEPLLYTRYRPDSLYREVDNYPYFHQVEPQEKINLINLLQGPSIYQDSFYLRDEAIQQVLLSLT